MTVMGKGAIALACTNLNWAHVTAIIFLGREEITRRFQFVRFEKINSLFIEKHNPVAVNWAVGSWLFVTPAFPRYVARMTDQIGEWV